MKMKTRLTEMLGIDLPLIAAPMFLVSNEDLVVEASEAGALGTFPALNYRPLEEYQKALKNIKARTRKPIGVNVIVNKSNSRQKEDIKYALEAGVEVFITSLGSPREVIQDAHKQGAKVICDVINLDHAKKVQDLGADAVIAVGSGAGGHAGPISPLVLIPWLKTQIDLPVIAAGGIAHGSQMLAALAMGAEGVSVGTRFIASTEAQVEASYKQAVVQSTPEDIMMTSKISGTPAAVIRTPYVMQQGTELSWWLKSLKKSKTFGALANVYIHWMGMKSLEQSAQKTTWKQVWSAGQSVGLIDEVLPTKKIIEKFIHEYELAKQKIDQIG